MAITKQAAVADKRSSKGVQSIERGFVLIRVLLEAGRPLPLKDLAASAGMSPSKAHSYVVSFKNVGLVAQDQRTGLYELGPFTADLGIARLAQQAPMRVAEKAIHALREIGCTGSIFVSIWSERGPVIVLRDEGNDAHVPFDIRVGYHSSLYFTATGNAFLAYMHPAVAQSVLEQERQGPAYGQRFPTEEEIELLRERIRRQEYAAISNGPLPGLTGIAVPIFGQGDRLEAVLTTIISSQNITKDYIQRQAKSTAKCIRDAQQS